MNQKNRERHTMGKVSVMITSSLTIDSALNAMDHWSTAMDMAHPLLSQYLHRKHLYLSDHQPHQPGAWPQFVNTVSKLQHWQLKSSDMPWKTTKIPEKYCLCLSSPQMSVLPKGWVYIEEGVEDKAEELLDPMKYNHLTHQCICTQHQ